MLVIATCLAGVLWMGTVWRVRSESALALHVAPESLDVGEVWETDAFEHVFEITNSSSRPVRIESIGASCECHSISPQSFTIAPHSSQAITLVLDLSPASIPVLRAAPVYDFSASVYPTVTSHIPPTEPWVVRGRVRRMFLTSSPGFVMDHGKEVIQGVRPAPQPMTVELAGSHTLAIAVEASVAEAEIVDAANDGAHVVQLTPFETLPLGPFETTVALTAQDHAGRIVSRRRIPVTGRVVGQVMAQPAAVEHGLRRLGDITDTELMLQSRTNRRFTVDRVETGSAELVSVSEAGEGDAGHVLIKLRQSIQKRGDNQEEIVVCVTIDGGFEERLVIPSHYFVP